MRRFFATTIRNEQAPTIQATNILYSAIATTSQSISWTRGNGAFCIVVVRASYPVNALPSGSYTANAAFGSGDQIGTGNYVVYSGTGTSVSITGLTAGALYFIRVYEGTGSTYLTGVATGNGVAEWTTDMHFDNGDQIETDFGTLTLAEQRATNRFVCQMKQRNNNWQYMRSWIPLCGYSTSTKALFNWVTGTTATIVNSPSYAAATGFTTNGTNNYVNTQVNPSTINTGGTAMPLNDASYGFHVIANTANANMGVIGTTSTGQVSATVTTGGVVAFKVHMSTTNSFTDAINAGRDDETYWLIRSASNVDRMYSNSDQIRGSTNAVGTVPAGRTIYIGARNNNGTADAFGAANYGGFFIVNSFTNFDYLWFQIHWEIFLMEMGVKTQTELYPLNGTPRGFDSNRVRVEAFASQSNGLFAAIHDAPPPSPLNGVISNAKTFERMNFLNPLTIEDLEYAVNHTYDPDITKYNGGLRTAYEISQLTNNKHYVWHYGISGTGLGQSVDPDGWHPDLTQKLFFDFTTRLGTPGFAAITEEVTEVYFNWSQGEADANAGRTQAQYTTDFYYFLSKFIDALESYGLDLTQVRFVVIITKIWSGLDTGVYPTRDDIRAAEAAFSIANYEADYPADAGKIAAILHYDNDKGVHTDGTHMVSTASLLEGYRVGHYIALN